MGSNAAFTSRGEGDSTLFEVLPAHGPKCWPLIAAGLVIFVLGQSGISILLVLLITGACIVLGLSDLRPLEHRTSVCFRVTPDAIEALGETFGKADIDDLEIASGGDADESLLGRVSAAANRLQQGKIDAVTHSVRIRSKGRNVTLAGGLDAPTAARLLLEVQDVLGSGQRPASDMPGSGYSRWPLTVARASVGLIAIDLRGFIGEVIVNQKNQWMLASLGDQGPNVDYAKDFVPMKLGERVSVFFGARRGKKIHEISGKDFAQVPIRRQDGLWGSLSTIIAVVNYSSGAEGIIPQPFNRMIVPNRALYNAMGIIAIFGGLFSVVGLFSGSPAGIVFLPVAIGFFVWMRGRQRKFAATIHAAALKLRDVGLEPTTRPAVV